MTARAKVGRPRQWPPAWEALAAAAGNGNALAEMLGTHRGTLRRWALGQRTPSGSAVVALRAVARELGVRSPV